MKALVTGSEGFIGRHMIAALRERDYDITAIDIADTLAPTDCRDFFRQSREPFDLVVHCAAVVGGRRMIEGSPGQLLVEDLSIDAEMFRWALRTEQPGRIVYFSSSAAYPAHLQRGHWIGHKLIESDIRLDDVASPDATYGWVKLTGELLARHANENGLKVHVFRPFSGYGPDQDLNYPFPSFVKRAAAHADPFVIWGDGSQVRDWVHVDDVVSGVMAAVEHKVLGPVNLCTGRGTSMAELALMCCEAASYSPSRFELLRNEPAGVSFRVGVSSAMRKFYVPQVDLEQGVLDAVRRAEQEVQEHGPEAA